jgi:hypothetical protein
LHTAAPRVGEPAEHRVLGIQRGHPDDDPAQSAGKSFLIGMVDLGWAVPSNTKVSMTA